MTSPKTLRYEPRSHRLVLLMGLVVSIAMRPAASQEPPPKAPEESKSVPDIILAVRQQDYTRIATVLAKGANPTVLSPSSEGKPGPSAWEWAVLLQDNRSLTMLLQNTGSLETAPMAGYGLVIAVSLGNREAVGMLLDKGIPVDVQPFEGVTPLLLAAGNGDSALVRLLLEKKAEVNHADPHGDTPLMAAVRAGPADAVRALLEGGAKPEMKDAQGRSAVHWATRYGRADLVELLVSEGAALPVTSSNTKPEERLTARAAVLRSLPLLQRSAAIWSEEVSCTSCHHQFLMTRVAGVARKQDFPLDVKLLRSQDADMKQDREKLMGQTKRALIDDAGMALATARAGRPIFEVAYSLASVAECGLPPDDSTELLARFLSKTQTKDGHWRAGLPRIPLSSSDFTTTACAIRALQAYGPASEAKATAKAIQRASAWLEKTKPLSTEDQSFRLQGLKWARADRNFVEEAAKLLKQEQNRDGSWAQMPGFNGDAYATGEVLVALRECGDVAIADRDFQRGIKYLLQSQEKDGSWLVHKRAIPFNGYLETGFPHGKFQISSFSGTCWATMALMMAEPTPPPGSSR